jgi:uncharacterized protein (DUF58 family)
VKRKRERIYIVPSWAAVVFSVVILLVFAVSFVRPGEGGLTRTLGVALVVAGVVALIQGNDNLRGVEITGCRAVPVAAGEDVVLELGLHNGADRERIGLRVRKGARWRTAWWRRAKVSVWVPVLDAGELQTVELVLPPPTSRRGRYKVPELWVCSVLPMGLCFAWKVFSDAGEYFVYPAPRGIPLEQAWRDGRMAGALVTAGGDSEDVSGHRSYVAGDLLSRMDWRVFARTGKLVVRTLEEGGGGDVALRWEDTDFLEGVEERLEQLSFWIAQCQAGGRSFTLELKGSGGGLGSRNVTACHEALAMFGGVS